MSQNPFSDPNFGSEFLSDEEKQSQAQTPAPAQAQTAAQPTGFKPRSTNPYSDPNYGAEEEGRTFGEIAKDSGAALMQGFATMGGDIAWLADKATGGVVDIGFQKAADRATEYWQDAKSDKMKASNQALAEAEGFTGILKTAWDRPEVIPDIVISSAPNALPVGAMSRAARAVKGAKAAVATAIGAGGALEGANAGRETENKVRDMTAEKLAEVSPQYMQLINQGVSHEEAAAQVANRAGLTAFAVSAPLAMLASKVTGAGRLEADFFTGKGLKGFFDTVLRESAEEMAQEASNPFGSNVGIKTQVNPNQSLAEGVPEGAALGLIAGAGQGTPMAALQRFVPPAKVQPTPTQDNPDPEPVERPDPSNGPISAAAAQMAPVQTAEDLGVQFPEAQDWSQYDRPAVQRQQDRQPQRADDVVSQMVGQARQIGDADAEVRLETANRLYRTIDRLMKEGNEEQARWNAYRADQIIREVSPRLPQAQQAEGAQTAVSTLPALITDDGVDLRDLAAQGQERAITGAAETAAKNQLIRKTVDDQTFAIGKVNQRSEYYGKLADLAQSLPKGTQMVDAATNEAWSVQASESGVTLTNDATGQTTTLQQNETGTWTRTGEVLPPSEFKLRGNLTPAEQVGTQAQGAEQKRNSVIKAGRDDKYGIDVQMKRDNEGFTITESDPNTQDVKITSGMGGVYRNDQILNREGEFVDALQIVQMGNATAEQTPFRGSKDEMKKAVELAAEIEFARKTGDMQKVDSLESQLSDLVSGVKTKPAPVQKNMIERALDRLTSEGATGPEVNQQIAELERIQQGLARSGRTADEALAYLDKQGRYDLVRAIDPEAIRLSSGNKPFQTEDKAKASLYFEQNKKFASVVPYGDGFAVRVDKARQKEEQRTGQQETAYLPDNTPINTRFVVVDLDELVPSNMPDGKINQAYPGELQPRDRTNANSMVQVRNISANLNPERLGSSRDASTGAPIVGPDGVVESGNGRTMAIAAAYQQGGDRAGAYRKYVIEQARQQGMDVDAVSRLKHPVLVRERISSIDRAEFARRANESQVAGMTAYEQAMSDADMLKADDLQLWEPDQSGDPLAASNRDFQRIFVRLLGNNEAARYTTRSGQASPELGARMQRAVFAKAYRDADMVEMVTEQSDQMRNLVAALQEAAPDLAVAREYGGQNAVAAISTINDAVRIVRKSRQDGTSVHDLTRQSDVFSEPVPETTAYVAEQIDLNIRSRRALADAMRYIGHAVRNEAETAMNGSLFGDSVTNEDIFGAAFRQNQDNGDGQQSPEWDVPAGIQEGEQNPAAGGSEQEAEVEPLLQSYTEEELAERERERLAEEARIAEEQRKTEEKAEADAQVDGFTLSGSNRPADVAASQGQQDLLGGGQVSQPDPNTVSENWKVIGENLQGHEVSENTVTGLRSWKSNSGSNTEQGRIEGDNTYESATDQVIRNRRVQYKTRSEIEAENEAANPPKTSDGREIVEHTTKKGRLLRGVIVEGLNLKQAKAIDQYSFKKGNGFYIKVENWEAHLAEQKPESKPEPKPEPNQETAVGIELDPDEALGGATADGQVTGMADNAPAAGDDGKAATLQKMVSKGEGVFNRMYQSLKKTTETEGVDYLESQSTLGLSQRKNLEVFLDSRGYSRKTNQAGSTRVNVEDNSNEQISITFSPGGSAVMRVARGTAEDSVAVEQAEPGQSQRTYTQQELRNAHRMAASVMHGKLNGLKALPLRQIAKPFLESQGVPVPRTKAETIAAVTDFDRVSALASVGVFNVELSDSVMGPLQAEMEGRIATEQAEPAPAVDIRTEGRENATEAEQAQAENQRPQVSENTIFTEDAAEEARRILMASLGQVNSGIDPKVMQAGITLAGYHIEKGARTFAAYAKAMTNDLGEMVKPYLKSWYMGVKYDPRAAGFDGMDDAATVDAADIDALLSAPATLETEANSQEVGDGTTESEMDQPDQTGVSATAEGRGGFTQPSSTQTDTQDLAGTEPGNVEPTASGETDGGAGVRAATENVADDGRTGGSGVSANGRPRTGGSRTPDAGTGSGSAAEGGRPTGGNAAPKPGVKDPASTSPAYTGPGNYHIDNPLEVVGGGQVARFNKNKQAIELFNDIRDNGRTATREEQDILAGYTGWGSFGQELFQGTWNNPKPKAGWEARDAWLREQLGQAEWESMQRSITNAHYTDPPTVMAMWDMVKRMGFEGGRVLEPSMGIGNFYGMMPRELKNRSQLSGIELDMMTGGMAQMLYPNANIKIMGYQESKTPDDFYDVIIGNWPFENTAIADRRYNKFSPMLHDYFFLKTLDQVRPGGIVIGITSKGSMDKKDSKIRSELAKKAELVASFRLPSGAFEEYAGTKVVTDIIILKKRAEPLGMATNEGWIKSVPYMTPQGQEVFINEYYASHPDHVIGTIEYGHGTTFNRPGMIVTRPNNMAEQLQRIVNMVPQGVFESRRVDNNVAYITNHTADREGSLTQQDGKLYVVRGEHLAPAEQVVKYSVKSEKTTAEREQQLRDLIGIRQAYAHLIEAENGLSGSDPEPLRKELRKQYNAFTKANGPLNESWGLQYLKRIDDPFRPALAALESERNGKTVPAAILERSTIRTPRTIDNPTVREAFVLARNESVNPTLDKIAQLSGKPAEEVKTELIDSGAVFELPGGDIVPSDIYLSGNVREKMRQAVAALEEGNAAMQHNIDELQKVMPKDVPYFNIEAQLGASWVPTAVYEEYVAHMLDAGSTDDIRVTYAGGKWKVDIASRLYLNTAGSTGFGTPRYNFNKLVNAAFGNQTVTIKAKDPDGNEFVDEEGSAEVNGKISDMRSKFKEWLWQDPDRRLNVEREYNEVRNAYATPRFDGSFLRFDGMALTLGTGPFNLRQHQADAIWRALVTRRSLNAHEVGTGKTFTMGGIAIESRRYGIAKKPLILAHNANSASVAHEIEMMYPAAKVLYIDNLDPKSIERKMRQIANDDWDAVVLPHSQLSKLALREDTLMAMAQEDIADLERQAIEAAEEDGAALDVDMMDALLDGDKTALKKVRSPTAKDLVKMRNRVIETIRKQGQKASKANAISFEELGIDMLLVDEAHVFKKPPFATRMKMKGLNTQASDASIALNFLARYVRANNNGGNIHLFTGTPVTNTLTEVFHMMRYIMNEEMQQQDLDQWDGWFNSFASEVMDIELNGAGEYEPVTRLAGFINVPELRKMIGQYMDTVFADDMPEMQPRKTASGKTLSSPDLTELERADLLNGRTEGAKDRPYKKVINESSDLSPEQMDAFNEVKRYAQAFRNMTPLERKQAAQNGEPEAPLIYERIANEASFDVRLLKKEELAGQEGKVPDHPNSKISRAINNILEIYHSDDRATQVVFSDTGLHKTGSRSVGEPGEKQQITFPAFSPIHDMIERLVQAGIPREQIALIAGSNTSKEKRKEIAEKMNRSEIRVVLGSTASLGVGVNMQKNLRAMHHLDAPWMPGDLEQRNGRGHRQGNQWNTVLEYRYLTDRIDGRRWQVLAVKQRFINAFLKANEDSRIIEGDAASDDGSDILESFSEAAGDPRILIRKKMESKLEQMRQRRRLHDQGMVDAKNRVAGQREKLRRNQEEAKRFEQSGAIERAQQIIERNAGANFTMKIGDQTVTDRKTAQELIESFVAENVRMGDAYQVFGEFDGLPVQIALEQRAAVPYLKMDINGIEVKSNSQKVITLENALRALPKTYNDLVAENAETEQNIQRLIQVSNEPFSQEKELQRMEQDLAALEQDIQDNPVAPPVWLRNGAPLETEVQWKGKPFEVTGHRWNSDGWFVLAKDARGSVVIPYTEVTDNQGMPLYEEREFESPDVVTKDQDQSGDDAIIKNTPQFSRSIPQTNKREREGVALSAAGGQVPEQSGVVRVIYRGTNDSGERISGGIAEGTLFAAADEATARNYAGTGGKIERIGVKQDAKVLVEGTKEFAQVTGRRRGKLIDTMRKGENLKTAADDAAAKARAAGYDALEFTSLKDLGIAIFNEDKFVRDYSPSQQLNQSPAFDGPEVGNTPIGDATEIEVDGKQRPTRNSAGQLIHPTEEGIRNFFRWFGSSRVVDEQGRPLVVYHGTAEDFDAFRNTPNGAFFFDDKELAELYGKPVPAYLSLKNPAIVDAQGQFWNEMDAVQSPVLDELRKHVPKLFTVDHIKQAAQKAGYDGAIILNTVDNGGAGNQYIAFRPEQVKSATGNNGAFDPDNPDIRFSQGESVTGTPLSVTDLDTVFNRIAPRLKNGQGYRIFENVRDLFAAYPAIEQHARKQGSNGSDVEGVFHKGQILIVRNKVTSRAQAEALMFHEATHGGVNAMMADEGITKAANRLFMAMGGGRGFKQHMERLGLQDKLRPYIKGSMETGKDGKLVMTPEERRAMLVHELLAFTGEKNSKGIKQKARELIGFIRQWFRKHGYLASSELSTAEISYMVRQARKYTLGGKGKAGAPRFIAPTMFSRSQESGNVDPSNGGDVVHNNRTLTGKAIPILVIKDSDAPMAGILTNAGNSRFEFRVHPAADAHDMIDIAVKEFIGEPKYLNDGEYYRFTNSKNEQSLIRSGKFKASTNHADGITEDGISVADGPHYGVMGYKYGYRVTGDVIGTGADGEPVMNPSTMKFGKVKTTEDIEAEARDIRNKFFAQRANDLGISENVLRYLSMPGNFNLDGELQGRQLIRDKTRFENAYGEAFVDDGANAAPMFRRSGESDADLSVVAKAQRTLGNNDRNAWDKVKRTFKRNFTAAGLLPDSVFREKVLRDSEVNAHEFDTAHYIGALDRAISKAYGASYNKLTDAQREALDAQMKSTEPDMSIPEPVRVALMDMRRSIAGLSQQYAEILQQQVEELQAQSNDADAMENAMLLETIINNMDTYAHRSYRAFDDPDWPAKVSKDPEIFPQAVEYLKNRQMEQGMQEAEAEQQAIRIARTILEEGTAYEDMTSMIKESKLGAKDLSILKRRKDIAPEIRALLGEYKDVKINYAKTLAKMSRLVANTKLLDRIKEIGLAEGWLFTEDNKPLDQSVTKVAGDASEVYAPLNGYYVPNEINQALIDTLGKEQMADWLRAVIRMNGLVKYGKTALSPTTAFRNWMSAAFFAMANGHFDITQMRKSISGFSEYFGHGENPEKVAYLRKLKELGVVYDTAYAGEMMDLLADAKGGWAEKLFEKPGLSSLKAANGLAQKFYQYGDDFWKIMGFENEKAMLMKHKGMSEAEAEVEAAERIRNTYPTYSMTGRAVNWLRRFPLAGTFVSFPAEIIRTQFHMLRYLKQDMKDSPAYAARKVVGLAMVSGLAYAAQALSKDLFDIGDDEEEAVRLLAASWNSNSNIWFMGRDENGSIRYLDFSFLDPYNYFKRPINAVMRDQPLDKAAIQAAGEMLSPFFGTDIAFGAISEIWNNKKEGGGRVYNPQDMALDQAQSIAKHLRKAIQPGFVGNMERAWMAANDQVTASGKRYKAEEELAAFFGFRASTFDPKTALYYNSFEFKDRKRDATAVLMNVAKDPNSVSDGDLMRAYDTASRSRLRAYTDMIRLVQAARAAGMNNMQVNASLRRSGISKADIRALMQGRIPAWRPDQSMMRNTIRKAELLYGPDVVREMRERERAIIQRGYRE